MGTRAALRLVGVRVVAGASASAPDHTTGDNGKLDDPGTEEASSTAPDGGDFALSVDHEGLTLHLTAIPSVVRHFAWTSVDALSVGAADPGADRAPRTSLDLTVEGQSLRLLVPAEQLPPASLSALEDIADAAFDGSTPGLGVRRVPRGHGLGLLRPGRRPRACTRVVPDAQDPQDVSVRRARHALLGVVVLVVALSLTMATTSRTPVSHRGAPTPPAASRAGAIGTRHPGPPTNYAATVKAVPPGSAANDGSPSRRTVQDHHAATPPARPAQARLAAGASPGSAPGTAPPVAGVSPAIPGPGSPAAAAPVTPTSPAASPTPVHGHPPSSPAASGSSPTTTTTPATTAATTTPATTVSTVPPGGKPPGFVPPPVVGLQPVTLIGAITQVGLGLVGTAATA